MILICSHPDCHLPVDSNGLCPGHRTQARRQDTLSSLQIKRADYCHVRACHQPATPDTPGWCAQHLIHADPTIWTRIWQ